MGRNKSILWQCSYIIHETTIQCYLKGESDKLKMYTINSKPPNSKTHMHDTQGSIVDKPITG